MKNTFQRVLAAAFVGAGVLGAGVLGGVSAALAAKDSLTLAMVLEPPHLDPTSHAAAAIDEVVYANIFEGLTRIDRNGAVQRSEEHTSELQSLMRISYAVFCLTKKKQKQSR